MALTAIEKLQKKHGKIKPKEIMGVLTDEQQALHIGAVQKRFTQEDEKIDAHAALVLLNTQQNVLANALLAPSITLVYEHGRPTDMLTETGDFFYKLNHLLTHH